MFLPMIFQMIAVTGAAFIDESEQILGSAVIQLPTDLIAMTALLSLESCY